MSPAELRRLGLADVETLYADEARVDVPRGLFRGRVLHWLPTHPGDGPFLRPSLRLAFEVTPFGVDFVRRRWFFGPRCAPRLGRFEPVVGPSQWRSTDAVQLHYHRSRLPRPLREMLYDEVKTLSDDLCLGIGGVNDPAGPREHFFFSLERFARGAARQRYS